MIWTEGPHNLNIFYRLSHDIHSTIKFNIPHPSTRSLLLATVVYLLTFTPSCRQTPKFTLFISSCGPLHTLRRICSTEAKFNTCATYLLKRGYMLRRDGILLLILCGVTWSSKSRAFAYLKKNSIKFVFYSSSLYPFYLFHYVVGRCIVIVPTFTRPDYVFIFSNWFPIKRLCLLNHNH